MTTEKRICDKDAYLELPYLLKPAPAREVQGRRAVGAAADNSAEKIPPPPPSAGFNPYFDLPPDSDRPLSVGTKELRR